MLYIFPAILLLIWPFYPESPYYLIKKGRSEAARKALSRIHGSKDPDFLRIEYQRIEANVRMSEELANESGLKGPGYYRVFRGSNLVLVLLLQRLTYSGEHSPH